MSKPFDTAYLDGSFGPIGDCRVSALDRGFLFGDGVYEVIPVYGGRMFRCDQHLARLAHSLAEVRIAPPLDATAWAELLETLIERNGGGDMAVYLQVTRGTDDHRDHAFPRADLAPTVFAMCSPIAGPPADVGENGVRCVLVDDLRWARCDIKSVSLLANVLHRQAAREAGAMEALLVRQGRVVEGSASTMLAVIDGVVTTPAPGSELLPGVTRDLLLELLRDDGIPVSERDVRVDELLTADEVWISSSNREVLPVTRIDDHGIGDGRPGPLWRRAFKLYQTHKAAVAEGRS